ncbi:MAG: DNA-directed RNA polymerase subunit omega [Ruminococcaceae bacterium]|nr:DNA-directed RNA polymerase subunit omega [Oscillospiraceae bacterium]
MLKPSMSQILKEGESYYSLVVAVAKRAREIAEEAENNNVILIEKPVQLAVEDFANGKCKLIESDKIGVPEE